MGYKTYNCPVNKRCGACEWLNVPYPIQLRRKQESIQELLGKYCPIEPIKGMAEPLHFRNKLISPYAPGKRGGVLYGMYQKGTHRIVPSKGCVVTDPESERIVEAIANLAPRLRISPYNEDSHEGILRHAVVRSSTATGEIMVTLVCTSLQFPNQRVFVQRLLEAYPRISTIVVNLNTRNTNAVMGTQEKVLHGRGYIEEEICGCRFRISSQSFLQTNHEQTQVLYDTAIEYAQLGKRDLVVDAYCGIGTIGIIAASRCMKVIGTEEKSRAVSDARVNARLNGVRNAEFVAQDAAKFMLNLAKEGRRIDVLFMDPPRAGATPEFLAAVGMLHPSRVVYISCNPKSLERDLVTLTGSGYKVKRICPVDMFPHTSHVETVVLLTRG